MVLPLRPTVLTIVPHIANDVEYRLGIMHVPPLGLRSPPVKQPPALGCAYCMPFLDLLHGNKRGSEEGPTWITQKRGARKSLLRLSQVMNHGAGLPKTRLPNNATLSIIGNRSPHTSNLEIRQDCPSVAWYHVPRHEHKREGGT